MRSFRLDLSRVASLAGAARAASVGAAIARRASVIALLLLAPWPAAATSIFQIQASLVASAFDAGFDGPHSNGVDTGQVPIGPLPYSLTASHVASAAIGTAAGTATASGTASMAAPGSFVGFTAHAAVSTDASAPPPILSGTATSGTGQAQSFVLYTDELIAGGPGIAVGTPLAMSVSIMLDGTMSLTGSPPGSVAHNYAQLSFADAGLGTDPIDQLSCLDLSGPCVLSDTGTITVLAGIPYQVRIELLLTASASADSTPSPAGASGDFLTTAHLFIDAQAPGVTYTLASGGDLRSVPEPSTAWLLGVAAGLVFWKRKPRPAGLR